MLVNGSLGDFFYFLKHIHIVLRDKFNTHLKETKKKGFHTFVKEDAKIFFLFKILLEERGF